MIVISDLAKLNSTQKLIDKAFLDYVQISVQCDIVANMRKAFNVIHSRENVIHVLEQHDHSITAYCEKFKLYISGNSLKLYITGNQFVGKNLAENLVEVEGILLKLKYFFTIDEGKPVEPLSRNAWERTQKIVGCEYHEYLKQFPLIGWRPLQLVKWATMSVSRIDFALNVKPQKLSDISIFYKGNSTITEYYDKTTNAITGKSVGNKKETVRLSIYQKWLAKNIIPTIAKYGTDEFTRIEWSIGRRALKRLGEGRIHIPRLDELDLETFTILMGICVSNKIITLNTKLVYDKEKYRKTIKVEKRAQQIEIQHFDMIQGILKRYQHLDDYNDVDILIRRMRETAIKGYK